MDLEHMMVNGIWDLVFVLPDDFFFVGDFKESSLGSVTDEGVPIGQPLRTAQVDSEKISGVFRGVPPGGLVWFVR